MSGIDKWNLRVPRFAVKALDAFHKDNKKHWEQIISDLITLNEMDRMHQIQAEQLIETKQIEKFNHPPTLSSRFGRNRRRNT